MISGRLEEEPLRPIKPIPTINRTLISTRYAHAKARPNPSGNFANPPTTKTDTLARFRSAEPHAASSRALCSSRSAFGQHHRSAAIDECRRATNPAAGFCFAEPASVFYALPCVAAPLAGCWVGWRQRGSCVGRGRAAVRSSAFGAGAEARCRISVNDLRSLGQSIWRRSRPGNVRATVTRRKGHAATLRATSRATPTAHADLMNQNHDRGWKVRTGPRPSEGPS